MAQQSQSGAIEAQKGVQSVNENTKALLVQLKEFQDIIEQNNKAIEEIMLGITGIVSFSSENVDLIKELMDRTNAIDITVGAIANVNIQTNMLSVNGAVEAARSGKFGKGFEVVALDIKKLADESRASADKMKTQVTAMKEAIQKAMDDVVQVSGLTRIESERGKKSVSNIQTIMQDISFIHSSVNEITDLSEMSNKSSKESLEAIDGIAKVAIEISNNTKEVTAISDTNIKNLAKVANIVQEVAKMTERL